MSEPVVLGIESTCDETAAAMQSARGRKGGRENKHDGESRYQKYLEYMKEAAE